jgi:outer membrane protein OmpA-like peptidoglycan-associated protein
MKNYRFVFILLLVVFQSEAQFAHDYTKFSIKPHFGFGLNVRRPAELTFGTDVMEVINRSFTLGQLNSPNGDDSFEFRTTHKIGISADYAINKDISFGVDVARYSQVFVEYSPLKWIPVLSDNVIWIDVIKYNTFGVHAKKTWYGYSNSRFLELGLNTTSKKSYPLGIEGDYSKNGTGVYEKLLNERNPLFVNASIGMSRRGGWLIPFKHEIILGANLPLTYLTKVSFNYQRNNKLVGSNEIKFSQSAIWLEVGFPIAIIKHRTRIINNPPPRQEPLPPPAKKPEKEIKYEGKKINKGENIVLQNITFEQGSDVLKGSSMVELNKLVSLMNQYENINIIIAGHTSDEGDRDANINLSKRRAESCKKYLREEGIRSKRIETKGYGPDFPISKTNKEINRRVEFKVE